MQTIAATSTELHPALETALAVYRHKIFVERLGWTLPVRDGVERDQFDRDDTFYVVAHDGSGAICGCARLLPTTRPYLLGEVFPQLMGGAPVPSHADVWELSRFAVASADLDAPFDSTLYTRDLLAAAVSAAAKLGARRLITVSPLGVERLLHRMGVSSHRAGPPMLVDGKPVFACWIELDAITFDALGISAADTVAIKTAAGAERRIPRTPLYKMSRRDAKVARAGNR